MITQPHNEFDVQSTLSGRKIDMGIAKGGEGFVMDALTKLYNDEQMAIIREMSTNAWDSHVAAGVTRPIEVTTPTDLSMFITIKDYGLGMDAYDIEEIYSLFGASTKRETNEQTGSLGLGCKSPLAYANQFTVVGVKDGVMTNIIVSRDDDGSGSMTIVDMADTDEPNGVTVQVPAKRFNAFKDKAGEFFSTPFWNGKVMLNGQKPKTIEGLKVTDDIIIVPGHDEHKIVMGGVPYPAKFNDLRLKWSYSIIAEVPIGDVSFSSSREGLRDEAADTKAAILDITTRFNEAADEAVQGIIDAEATTMREALTLASKWRAVITGSVESDPYTYNGTEIPISFSGPQKVYGPFLKSGPKSWQTEELLVTQRDSHTLSKSSSERVIYAGTALSALWIHGFEGKYGDTLKFTGAHKKKLKKYCELHNIEAQTFILTIKPMNSPWIDQSEMVDWSEVNKIKLEVNRSYSYSDRPARPKGSYDMLVNGNYQHAVQAEKIDTSKPLFYANTTMNEEVTIAPHLTKHHEESTIVYMASNRIAKFERDFPNAVNVRTALDKIHVSLEKSITKSDVRAYSLRSDYTVVRELDALDANRIDDPDLSTLILLANSDLSKASVTKIENVISMARALFKPRPVIDHDEEFKAPSETYPLLGGRSYCTAPDEHIYLYINAVYNGKENN